MRLWNIFFIAIPFHFFWYCSIHPYGKDKNKQTLKTYMGLKEKVASIRRILGGVTHTPTIKTTEMNCSQPLLLPCWIGILIRFRRKCCFLRKRCIVNTMHSKLMTCGLVQSMVFRSVQSEAPAHSLLHWRLVPTYSPSIAWPSTSSLMYMRKHHAGL